MSRAFFDTNVVLYVLDTRPAYAEKSVAAHALFRAKTAAREAVISTQVLQEAYDNGVRKLRIPPGVMTDYVRELSNIEVVTSEASLVLEAIAISQRYQFRIFDALMIAAAKRAGCATLYTEDLSHGQVIDAVRIANPFKEDPKS